MFSLECVSFAQHVGQIRLNFLTHLLPRFLVDNHLFKLALFPVSLVDVGSNVADLVGAGRAGATIIWVM